MPFPNKQNELSALDVLDTVTNLSKTILNFHTFKMRDLDDEKIAYFIENNLISKDLNMQYGGVA